MCLIVFAYDRHPKYRLILANNRDEYFARPTRRAEYWSEHPSVLAGRDLRAGGTWLGVTTNGRLAAITNYRDPAWQVREPPSRGQLVTDYLAGNMSPVEYLKALKKTGHHYKGFNLLFGDCSGLFYYSNRGETENTVRPGIHGLSNHLLNTPWPKVTTAKERLQSLLDSATQDPEEYFAALGDETPFPDEQLPDTGVGSEMERLLSPMFITTGTYGTRFTTLIFIDRENGLRFIERSYDPQRSLAETKEFKIMLPGVTAC